jgi:hypothetical protein
MFSKFRHIKLVKKSLILIFVCKQWDYSENRRKTTEWTDSLRNKNYWSTLVHFVFKHKLIREIHRNYKYFKNYWSTSGLKEN